jgi:Ca2+:H+ antiporter
MKEESQQLQRPRPNSRNYSTGLEPHAFFHHNDGDDDDDLEKMAMKNNEVNNNVVENRSIQVQAMGERPLAFQLVAQAKKFSRQNIEYDPNSSFAIRKRAEGKQGEEDHMSTEESNLLDSSTENRSAKRIIPLSWEALHDIIFGKLVSIFLIFIPFCFLAKTLNWGPVWVFWFNFFVMIPLAAILGDFTEMVAAHTNQVIGGLVNATFGNAVEVVVAVQALLANEIRVVQASMIGSIFSNLLLVLGCCFFFGGIRHKEQPFNQTAATANMSLLALSSIALVLPTPFAEYYQIEDSRVLLVSRTAAIFLMSMYVQLLIFQLRTHSHLFEDEDDEDPQLSMRVALIGLCLTTLAITVFSDMLVESIDGFVVSTGISRTFVGLIILPIVGNAVEHITAVTVAMKNKMDLAMGVAVGSCTQISLFVVPFTVLVGWALNRNMTLNFPAFEIMLYTLSVVIVSICLSNPKGNWLLGSLLITTYIMVAVGFFFEDVKDF